MKLLLHKFGGQPACPPVPVTLRCCTPDEAPAVYALQNEVHAAMPHPEWFVPSTQEEITEYITNSLCIAWRVPDLPLLRAGTAELRGLSGRAPAGVGALGQR